MTTFQVNDRAIPNPQSASQSDAHTLDPSTLAPSPKSVSELQLFTMPRGGIDRLNFQTWDTIVVLIPGQEPIEDTIELRGYYQIERANPTSANWQEASVDIFMRELFVVGTSQYFGRLQVGVNHDIGKESRGQVKPGTIYDSPLDSPKMCEMEGYMKFELTDVGISVFNKDPIQLRHSITHIPPVGQGGGTRDGVEVNLYRTDDPEGAPVAILRRVKTHIGAWLDK
jgi:hypothetical protein